MKIKVMQFNIRTGFRKIEKPYDYENKRIELAKKIIEKEKPDILMLNEAYFESQNETKILMNYQKIFNYKFYAHGNYEKGLSPFWGSAILSKHPIIQIVNKNKGLIGLLSTKIKINETIINIDLTHISPISCLNNKRQKKAIEKMLKNKKENHILAGDFNSLSPQDKYNEKKFIKAWNKLEKNNLIKEMLKRDAVKTVLSKGLIDTYKAKNEQFDYTIPTDFLSKNKSTGIRIDYIFCSKNFKIIKSGIIKNRLTQQASDHYPIYSILEI